MDFIYMGILGFLLVLTTFDLFVGVANDAVNFLSPAVGARAAKFRTILIVAAVGIFVGAATSSGMMDIARHGILNPAMYSFEQVMCIFLAVAATDVVLLDILICSECRLRLLFPWCSDSWAVVRLWPW